MTTDTGCPVGASQSAAPNPGQNIFESLHCAEGYSPSTPEMDVTGTDCSDIRMLQPDSFLNANDEAVTFEFTCDLALSREYTAIYEREFKLHHDVPEYRTVEDDHHRRAFILIACQGGRCIGGARLSVRTPDMPYPLPIEMDGFTLEDQFPRLRGGTARYGQIGRICLLPEFRGGKITRMMLGQLYRKIVSLDLQEIFGTCTTVHARAYKTTCVAMGLKHVRIYENIRLPAYPMCERERFILIGGTTEKHSESFPDKEEI